MKKLLLLSSILLFVTLLSARPVILDEFSQSILNVTATDTLELYDNAGNKINNGTIYVTITDPLVDPISCNIWIKNTTTTDLVNAYVHRTVNSEVPGTMNSFCFGVMCYGPGADESIIPTVLQAGVVDQSFIGDYYAGGLTGTTSVTYEFFDNTTFPHPVKARATVNYRLSFVGVSDNKLVFKGPFPNPSSQNATFEYSLPAGSEHAQIIIRNILGIEVENCMLGNQTGKKVIDVSNYAAGIYFYTLTVDGKVLQSRKMTVKH
jgi:hypothetical protein